MSILQIDPTTEHHGQRLYPKRLLHLNPKYHSRSCGPNIGTYVTLIPLRQRVFIILIIASAFFAIVMCPHCIIACLPCYYSCAKHGIFCFLYSYSNMLSAYPHPLIHFLPSFLSCLHSLVLCVLRFSSSDMFNFVFHFYTYRSTKPCREFENANSLISSLGGLQVFK